MTTHYGNGWTVEAAIVHENGKLTFVAADAKQHGLKHGPTIDAIAWCDLKADVSPHGHAPSEIFIHDIYACNQSDGSETLLTGEDRDVAEAILLADDGWLKWAREEISHRRAA